MVVQAADVPRLVDNAKLLNKDDFEKLAEKLDALSEKYDMDVVIITTNSIGNKTAEAYTDDYYDYNGFKEDGICLLVDMTDRYIHISTSGFGIKALTDKGIDYILDDIAPSLTSRNYGHGLEKFIKHCDNFIAQAKKGESYDIGNMPKSDFDVKTTAVISLLGILIAGIICAIFSAQLKSVKKQATASQYHVANSLNLTNKQDQYLYNRISKIKIETSSSGSSRSGGGSSTHSSSSGRSHGGGGRHF